LLEGLEAVEINLSQCQAIIDFRIDSSTYKKEYLATEQLLEKKQIHTIGDISKSIQNFGAYSLCNFINFQDEGIPFLMTKNIRKNYIDWNIEKFVDQASHNLLWISHCYRDQVLVTMAGEYLGRVAVYNSDKEASSNQAIAKVSLKKGNSPYTVSTFLNSKFGQYQIQRFKTITGQPNINMALIASLKVPEFSEQFCQSIERLMMGLDDIKVSTLNTYAQAETILLNALGMVDFSPSTENVNVKSFKESFLATGRLDAEYYQPKYEQIEQAIISFSGDVRLKDLVGFVHTGEYAEQYLPKANGLKFYIRSTNINNGLINDDEDYYVDPVGFTKFVQQGDIVTARVGTLGIFGAVDAKTSGSIYSDNVLCFRLPNTFNADVYTLWFNSKLNFELIDRLARGSVQQRLNQETLKDLLVPIIATEIQSQIANLVQDSFTLKAKSERLLEVAKRAVEIAIEQDEAAGMAYIEANIEG